MEVGKIFKVLIVIVVCVLLGAFVINSLVPNATTGIVDAVESMIFKATGLEFDFNQSGSGSDKGVDFKDTEAGKKTEWNDEQVEGFD